MNDSINAHDPHDRLIIVLECHPEGDPSEESSYRLKFTLPVDNNEFYGYMPRAFFAYVRVLECQFDEQLLQARVNENIIQSKKNGVHE